MSTNSLRYTKWSPVITVYYTGTGTIAITVSQTTINITDGVYNSTVTYINKSLQAIVGELNNLLPDIIEIRNNLDIGPELLIANSLYHTSEDITYDNALVIRYSGHIFRYEENTVIQLKPPYNVSKFEPWYARIGNGKIRARFSDISFTSYPGINPNAIYTFSIPEFSDQDWSINYGPPYKDVYGEIPFIKGYNSALGTTILRVQNTPIFYKNNNISIAIKGIRQPNSIIKYVDENNGLIYITQKLSSNIELTVDYSYKESDYLYDGIDLNASINHNPLIVDSFIAFYLKPSSADGALISGGNSIFHEILNTSIAGKSKVAQLVKGIGLDTPIYEPVIYLGSINVRQANEKEAIEIIDTRTRGGGLYVEDIEKYKKEWREAEYFYDIGSLDGISIPGQAAVVISLPDNLPFTQQEIKQRASKDIALGIVPIFDEKITEVSILNNIELRYNNHPESGFYISSLSNDSVEAKFLPFKFWSIKLRDTYGNEQVIGSDDFISFNAIKENNRLRITWNNNLIRVTCNIDITTKLIFGFKIAHINKNYSVSSVRFPIVLIDRLGPSLSTDVLILPIWSGAAQVNPSLTPYTSLVYPGWCSFQCLSIWDTINNKTLYFQTTDTLGYNMEYKIQGISDACLYFIDHTPEAADVLNNGFNLPFDFRIHLIDGDWYDGTQIYYQWMKTNTPWGNNGPMEVGGHNDLKLVYLAGEVNNPNVFNTFASNAISLKNYYDASKMVWLPYYWHSFNYSQDLFPDVEPVQSTFTGGIATAQASGILVAPYNLVNYWNNTGATFQTYTGNNLSQYNISGATATSSTHVRLMAWSNPYFYTAESGIHKNLVETYNWDGIYLDDFASYQNILIDYSTGSLTSKGVPYASTMQKQRFAKDMRAATNSGFAITEFAQELYIDSFDGMRGPMQNYGVHTFFSIPLWQSIYHEYILTTDLLSASPLSVNEVNEQLVWATAIFHYGNVVTLIHTSSTGAVFDNTYSYYYSYIKKLMDAQQRHSSYLRYGKRLRPQNLLNDALIVFTSLRYYSSIWQNDTGVAIALTNGTNTDVNFNIDMTTANYPIQGSWNAYDITSGNNTYLSQAINGYNSTITVPVYSERIIELRHD